MASRTKKERRARKRKLWLIAAPLIVMAAMFWPLIGIIPSDGAAPTDPVTVTDYRATYKVDSAGNLAASETIVGKFPNGRHGIFRFWDAVDPNNPLNRFPPAVTSITMDGHPEPYELSEQGAGRYTVAKIGNPDVLLRAGLHTYTIEYSQAGVIAAAQGQAVPSFATTSGKPQAAQSVFWWNVVANGWRMPIAAARVTVNLPSAAMGIQCSAKVSGTTADGPCQVAGLGTKSVVLSARNIPAFGGMTTRIGLPSAAPALEPTPWPWQLDEVLGTSAKQLGAILGLGIGALVVGFGWTFAVRERPPGLPVIYEPPAGLGPVQVVYISDETSGEHDVAATVFHLTEQGLLKIAAKPRSWVATTTDALTPTALAACDPVAQALLTTLGLTEPGMEFKASPSKSAGEKLQDTRKAIRKAAIKWAGGAGLSRMSVVGVVGRTLWVLAVVAIPFTLLGRWWPTIATLVPLGFAVGAVKLMKSGAARRRTQAGREIWSRAGGFKRMLSTPSSELRFDFSARKDYFLPYLPYALAFGVAKQWSDKYDDEMHEPTPTPDWINYSGRTLTTASMLRSVNSFDSTVHATISAYQAASSGSSGSGGSSGGSSVGSGGGGGGGGSW